MLSDEEKKAIEEQYKEGLVNLSNVIEPLINQFKTDYSLDIQQCRLIINYLLMERDFNEDYYDELDKEIEELKDFITKLQATKDRLDSYDKENTLEIEKLNKEIEELKAHQIIFTNDYKPIGSKGKKFISEDKIKKEIEEIRKTHAPEDDYAESQIYILQSLLEKE